MNIYELFCSIHQQEPSWNNEQVAVEICKRVPGAKTTSASVASMKSRYRKEGAPSGGLSPSNFTFGSNLAAELPEESVETYQERDQRIRNRYATLDRMAKRVVSGHLPSLIVSGPPGLGKSFSVEQTLQKERKPETYRVISGGISSPGLYINLYEMREDGVLVLDDCDDVFRDEASLNILKAVLDSSQTRIVSWMKEANWLEKYDIPNQFEFKGTVVFCTNLDFDSAIMANKAIGAHYQALIDRSLYLSLSLRNREDVLCRLYQVGMEDGILTKQGLTEEQAEEVFAYITENADKFYNLSIRLLLHAAYCRLDEPDFWELDLEATKMRRA